MIILAVAGLLGVYSRHQQNRLQDSVREFAIALCEASLSETRNADLDVLLAETEPAIAGSLEILLRDRLSGGMWTLQVRRGDDTVPDGDATHTVVIVVPDDTGLGLRVTHETPDRSPRIIGYWLIDD